MASRTRASRFQLAEVNIALPREPVTSPLLAEFVALLEPINHLADESDGFVWRLQTDSGDATAIRAFDDDRLIVNLSVWETLETLQAFAFRSRHVEVMRRRREWFQRLGEAYVALWWVPAGHRPTVTEAEKRLDLLRRLGPTAEAFTFREPFGPPRPLARPRPPLRAAFCPVEAWAAPSLGSNSE